jgi:putative aminopeptidase FrvX
MSKIFDIEYFKEVARLVFNTDSPSGFTTNATTVVGEILTKLGYEYRLSNKGNIILELDGEDNSKTIATSAHLDTLGLMVRSINGDGTLSITNIGGPILPTLDGEYCKIQTREGKIYTGTILSTSPSAHVFKDASTKDRNLDNLCIRIDEKIDSREDVKKLSINSGDYVFIDTKFEITESNFLKSRFIDDKGSVCSILTVLKYFKDNNLKPAYHTFVYFVVHEEVGHGAATIDDRISEFVTVDMGCIGLDLNGSEYEVSIAAKDSGGPYDYELTNRLIKLAKENDVKYVVDIFPFYGSDVGAALRAGKDFKGALIGPGVAASHGMERTHLDSIVNTMELLTAYLLSK